MGRLRRRASARGAQPIAEATEHELGLRIGDLAAHARRDRGIELAPVDDGALLHRAAVAGWRLGHGARWNFGSDQPELLGHRARGRERAGAEELDLRRRDVQTGLLPGLDRRAL